MNQQIPSNLSKDAANRRYHRLLETAWYDNIPGTDKIAGLAYCRCGYSIIGFADNPLDAEKLIYKDHRKHLRSVTQ